MTGLTRLLILLLIVGVVTVAAWHGVSFLARDGLALAPIVGQYYLGESWMVTPTPLPTLTALPSPTTAHTPVPTATEMLVPTETPQLASMLSGPSAVPPLPTPDPYLVGVVERHEIDPASTYVVVNQNAQQMTIVESGFILRTLPISSGDPDNGWYTPAWSGEIGEFWGTFSANGVLADDAWYLFTAGGSILIHSLPYTLDENGNKQYHGANDLGVFPASRGCIRIAPEEARWFTEWGPGGVPIVILPWNGGSGRSG